MKNSAHLQYLNDILIPSFFPMVKQNIYFAIYDYADKLLLCSNLAAQELGFSSWQEICGQVYNDIYPQPEYCSKLAEEDLRELQQSFKHMREVNRELHFLKQFIFDDARPASIAVIQPNKHKFLNQFYSTTFIPLFNPAGEVIAIQEIRTNFAMFGMPQFLQELQAVKLHSMIDTALLQITPTDKLPLLLTERQHEIVFLLANGLSQDAIAALLNISRGTIAKTISQSICPKFDIWGSSTILLVQKAKALNMQFMLPKTFCKPRFVILDYQLAQRYHQVKENKESSHGAKPIPCEVDYIKLINLVGIA